MNKEKVDTILGGVSSVLDSLGELAEKGRKLKQAVHEAENQSSSDTESLHQLTTESEPTDSGWLLKASVGNFAGSKIDVNIQDNTLHIRIVKGQQAEYRDIELSPGCRIDSVQVDNDAGALKIHYSR